MSVELVQGDGGDVVRVVGHGTLQIGRVTFHTPSIWVTAVFSSISQANSSAWALNASPAGRRSRCMVNEAPQHAPPRSAGTDPRGRPSLRIAGSSLSDVRRLKVTMAPSGAAQGVHLVRQPTGASSLVSHQKITSSLFGVATKTSHTMLPGIIGNRHWQAHRAIPGADLWAETNPFDEAVLHDAGGDQNTPYPPRKMRNRRNRR
ncbi:Uncharacterised protein [Mycobacteroides abscessus]|nr:Uncharacterised protein [Mycobacteroides abscessus]